MERGEVWLVDLNPTVGSEISKTRPVVIVSRKDVGRLPLRIVVPLTGWRPDFAEAPWLVRIEPTPENGLSKSSAADVFQVRSASTRRFQRQLGRLSKPDLDAVAQALAEAIGSV